MENRLKQHIFFRLKEAGFDMDKTDIGKEPHLNVKKMRVLQAQYRLAEGSYGASISDNAIAAFYKKMVNIGKRLDLQNEYRKQV